MDYVSDAEFKEIRDYYFDLVTKLKGPLQDILNGIHRGVVSRQYLQRETGFEQQAGFEPFWSKLRLLKNSRHFTQEQLEVLAHFENEVKGYETSINNAFGQIDNKIRIEVAKAGYETAMNGPGMNYMSLEGSRNELVLNKKYVKNTSLYKDLCDMIDACTKFQHSEDWNLIGFEKQQNVNNRLQRLLQKQAEVVRISADVLSYKGKIILLAASVVLAVIASIQGLEWCCITVPLAYYYVFKILLPHQTQKNVDITIFAVYAAMMLSIIIPIKWSSVAIIPLAIFGYWYIKSNKDLIGQEEQKQ